MNARTDMNIKHIGDNQGEPLAVAVTEATFPYTEYDHGTPVVREVYVPRFYAGQLEGTGAVEVEGESMWIAGDWGNDGIIYEECCDLYRGRFLIDVTM